MVEMREERQSGPDTGGPEWWGGVRLNSNFSGKPLEGSRQGVKGSSFALRAGGAGSLWREWARRTS